MREFGLFINGTWRASSGDEYFESKNPATGEVVAVFPKATNADVQTAVNAAQEAFASWRNVPPASRGLILLKAAQILRDRKDQLGQAVTSEMGKVLAEGKGDVQEAIDFFEYIAGEGRRLLGETSPSELPNKVGMTFRQPVGVVGAITPWNFPVAIPSWKIGAALISGNTIVHKPASQTPYCAALLLEALVEAGLPKGVLNLVTGPASSVGRQIVEHPAIKAISFTGGVPAGTDVYVRSAKLLKRVELEMGGKNPQIIMEDADLDLAINGLLFGAFGTAGQRCTATSRLLLHKDIYSAALEKLIERTKALRVGNPLLSDVDVGPVSSQQQVDTITDYIQIGKAEGAELVFGGNVLKGGDLDRGFFVQPTIFAAKHGMRITKEEIFGPILSVIKFDSFAQAIHIANDVDYGLSASIYTRDVNRAFRAIEQLETGLVYINAPTIGAEVHYPFGGTKNTGNGGREAGSVAIDEFTEIKTVFIDYSNRLQKAQITDD